MQVLILDGDMKANAVLKPVEQLRRQQWGWKQLFDSDSKRLFLEDCRTLMQYSLPECCELLLVDNTAPLTRRAPYT
jgi:hypothetical protein